MRTATFSLSVVIALSLISISLAETPNCGCENAAEPEAACESATACSQGCRGKHCHRCHGKKQKYEGMSRNFNCGCNGSYNYPVPPLYTYHWPGMYKQVRMTDYHSPWRFPAIRPYTDEPLGENELSEIDTPEFMQQVSFDDDSITITARSEKAETSMSSRFENLTR